MTRKGWIIISTVALLIVLLIAGAIYYSNNPDAWPASVFTSDKDQKENHDKGKKYVIAGKKDTAKDDFVDMAAKTIFPDTTKAPVPVKVPSEYSYDATKQTGYASNSEEVRIGLIIAENEYDVKNVISGKCGDVYMVTYFVPGPDVLSNSAKALFGDKVFADFLPGNIIPSYHPNLAFKSAMIESGVAKINLTGSFSGSRDGKCDAELALAQLAETAKSFATVQDVVINLGSKEVYNSAK